MITITIIALAMTGLGAFTGYYMALHPNSSMIAMCAAIFALPLRLLWGAIREQLKEQQ